MPNLNWQELSDLKHCITETESKLVKMSKYLRGMVEIIDSLVGEHENES